MAVLQILKIRNISAPKANESSKTAPKLLKLQLTDGINPYSAIEMEPTALSIETKPGTKVRKSFFFVRGVIDLALISCWEHFRLTNSFLVSRLP